MSSAIDAARPTDGAVNRPTWRKVMHVAGTVLTVAVVVGWIVLLRPQSLGGPASYVMVSGQSMEPTYQSGDFVVALERDTYGVGDVIVYRVPEGDLGAGRLIIHRVIDGDRSGGFRTQGDNRPTPDEWRPTEDDIVGKLWFHIPSAGGVLPYLRSPLALGAFFGIFTFLLVALERKPKDEEAPSGEADEAVAGERLPGAPKGSSRERSDSGSGRGSQGAPRSWVRPALFLTLGLGAFIAGFLAVSKRAR